MKHLASVSFRIFWIFLFFVSSSTPLLNAQGPTNTVIVSTSASGESVSATIKTSEPVLTFGLHKIPELQVRIMDIPVWQYLASALYLLIALLAARLFDYIVTVRVKKITDKTKTVFDDLLVELLRAPVKMVSLVVMLQIGLNVFHWPAWLERWMRKGLYVLLAISITYMVMRLVDLASNWWKTRGPAQGDRTFNALLIPLVSKTLKTFILVVAILVTLDNLDFKVGTLLAGVSIGGLALGLAAQDTVGNLFGAAAVFIDKPFKIGDRVQLSGIDGIVEEIGLRSTRIRNLDGHLITVPNKTMGNATITNITRRPNIKTVMNIGITYDTPTAKVEEAVRILTEIYKGHPMTHDAILGFNQFSESSLNILVIHWWKGLDYKEYIAGLQQLNLTVKRRFDESGISFAFPSRTIYLKSESDLRVVLAQNNTPDGTDVGKIT